MANSKMIGKCVLCLQDYCQECSDAKDWEKYCTAECERDAAAQAEEEAKNNGN